MLALWLQKVVLRSGSYDIIKGKSMRPMLIKLRGAKIPLLIVSLLSLSIIVLVPLVMIILVGMLKAYGLPLTLENFTFDNYLNLFKSKMVQDSVVNSLTLSISAGHHRHVLRRDDRLRDPEDQAQGKNGAGDHLHPALFHSRHRAGHRRHPVLERRAGRQPVQHPVDHSGGVHRRYLAFSMKSASASLQQVHYSLEDAARTCGATHFESLTDVTLPLIRPAMISGFFLIFLPAMRELTTSVLLYGPYTRTLGVAIYSLRSDGYIVDASALASLAIVLIIICNAVVNAIVKDRKKV